VLSGFCHSGVDVWVRGYEGRAANSSWGLAVCAGAVPLVSAPKLARGRGNPLESIPAGSSRPHIALPPLAPAARGAMLPCHELQSAGARLAGNWERWARGRALPGDRPQEEPRGIAEAIPCPNAGSTLLKTFRIGACLALFFF